MVHELVTGRKNPRTEPKIMNFIQFIDTISPKAAEIASANLPGGPSMRWMQKLNACDRRGCILDSSISDMKTRLSEALKRPQMTGHNVSYSLSTDATKVPSELEILTAYCAIMGGAHPNHIISTRNMTPGEIKAIVEQSSASPMTLKLAVEIKVIFVVFQNCPQGVSPVEIIGARQLTSNETSSLTSDAIDAAVEVAALSSTLQSKVFFTNFAVDGVSAESSDVMEAVSKFLDGKTNYVGSVDNKYNAKNDRYQLIGGSCIGSIGNYVIDSDLLRQSGVGKDLWMIRDFASDKLAAELFSYLRLKKLGQGIENGHVTGLIGDVGALATVFCMMRLHLHSVNGGGVPPKHRSLYLYSLKLFFTSFSGISMTPKRNMVSETIANLFLTLRVNVKKISHCTSEPSEHGSGNMRKSNRGFTVADFCVLAEKEKRRMNAMFEGDLSPSQRTNKGYTAKFLEWVVDAKQIREQGGLVMLMHLTMHCQL
jgi:hypothetical protein